MNWLPFLRIQCNFLRFAGQLFFRCPLCTSNLTAFRREWQSAVWGVQVRNQSSIRQSRIFSFRPFYSVSSELSESCKTFFVEFRTNSNGWVVSDSVICVDYDWIIQIFSDFMNWIAKVHSEKEKSGKLFNLGLLFIIICEGSSVGYFMKVGKRDGTGLAIKNSLISNPSRRIKLWPFVSAMVRCRKSACLAGPEHHTHVKVIIDRIFGIYFVAKIKHNRPWSGKCVAGRVEVGTMGEKKTFLLSYGPDDSGILIKPKELPLRDLLFALLSARKSFEDAVLIERQSTSIDFIFPAVSSTLRPTNKSLFALSTFNLFIYRQFELSADFIDFNFHADSGPIKFPFLNTTIYELLA